MTSSGRDRLLAFLLALAAFGGYAGFLSRAYVFEGLVRAMPIETGRWAHLFAGNYLLYGPLGLTFHALLQAAGFQHLAVTSLQILDAVLGSAGIFLFYRILRRLGGDVFSSAAWTAVLGFSLGYWLWSTDAENYILSTLLLMTDFYFLVRLARGEKVDPVVLGALHGLAILGHIMNVVFGAVALWFLACAYGRAWRRPVGRYAAAATAVPLCAYAAVLAFVQKPATVQEALIWFIGSAGDRHGSITFGGGLSAAKFWEWIKMSLHIVGSFQPAYPHPPAWTIAPAALAAAWVLLGFFGVGFLVRFRRVLRDERAVAGGGLIWLAAYACVFTRWQPWTMVYRVSDLIPVSVLLFLAYQQVQAVRRYARPAVAALALCLGIGNLGAEIYPRSFASNNPHLARMAFLKARTAEGDWIAGIGGLDEMYIPTFAQRRPLVIGRYAGEPARLAALIKNLLAKKQNIFITSRILEDDSWKAFFSLYSLWLNARDDSGFALYQVRR